MNYRENVRAILETCFAGYKDELIEAATDRICSIKVKPLDSVLNKIKDEIFLLPDFKRIGNSITIYSWSGMQKQVFEIIDRYKEE